MKVSIVRGSINKQILELIRQIRILFFKHTQILQNNYLANNLRWLFKNYISSNIL